MQKELGLRWSAFSISDSSCVFLVSGIDVLDKFKLEYGIHRIQRVPPTETKLGSDLWIDVSTRGGAKLQTLFGAKVFDNPKPLGLIKRMLQFATENQRKHLVLDFFAGSCTTALGVLEQNREDGGNRQFMMVQLPIPPETTIALDDGFTPETIADIGKETIRREIAHLLSETKGQQTFQKTGEPEDPGSVSVRY